MIVKTIPTVQYSDFYLKVQALDSFRSITGNIYTIISLEDSILTFVRESTHRIWKVNLVDVYKAYSELTAFRTVDFKPYVPRKQSPALGLLVATQLLIDK